MNFDFSTDTTRQTTGLILSQDESAFYGVLEGTTNLANNQTILFRSDTELNFAWIVKYDATTRASLGFQLDSTESQLFIGASDGNCNLLIFDTTDGGIETGITLAFGQT